MKTPVDLVKVWLHEASRVYGDKLIEAKDIETFQKLKFDIAKAGFEVSTITVMVVIRDSWNKLLWCYSMKDIDEETIKVDPLIYCHFATGIGDPKYMPVPSWESLKKLLEEALESYNEINAIMNLVLFEDAMQHV